MCPGSGAVLRCGPSGFSPRAQRLHHPPAIRGHSQTGRNFSPSHPAQTREDPNLLRAMAPSGVTPRPEHTPPPPRPQSPRLRSPAPAPTQTPSPPAPPRPWPLLVPQIPSSGTQAPPLPTCIPSIGRHSRQSAELSSFIGCRLRVRRTVRLLRALAGVDWSVQERPSPAGPRSVPGRQRVGAAIAMGTRDDEYDYLFKGTCSAGPQPPHCARLGRDLRAARARGVRRGHGSRGGLVGPRPGLVLE